MVCARPGSRAAQYEPRLDAIGTTLFGQVFQGPDAQNIWSGISSKLDKVRIEVAAAESGAHLVPWELLRDPETGTRLAVDAGSFVRTHAERSVPNVAWGSPGPLRVLLVNALPGAADVAWRQSVGPIVKRESVDPQAAVRYDTLRPPNFQHLCGALADADAIGEPYHVVHIDAAALSTLPAPEALPPAFHGYASVDALGNDAALLNYLAIDSPTRADTIQTVTATQIAEALAEGGVPLIVLNAGVEPRHINPAHADDFSIDEQRTTMLSLANDAVGRGAGAALVLGSPWDPAVSSRWLRQLYAALAAGQTLGEALASVRRGLSSDSNRPGFIGAESRSDASAAVAFDPESRSLIAVADGVPEPQFVSAPFDPVPSWPVEHPRLGILPGAGQRFFGRGRALEELDRQITQSACCVLSGEPGMGKSRTAAEFARWYANTAGIDGPVIWTSFEQHRPLGTVLDQLSTSFGSVLRNVGYYWARMPAIERRQLALHVLNQVPVLWIWDGLDAIDPDDPDSAWTAEEREELASFLDEAVETQGRFLLTHQEPHIDWIPVPQRSVALDPMDPEDILSLAAEAARTAGHDPRSVGDWKALVEAAEGSPLVVKTLTELALAGGQPGAATAAAQLAASRATEGEQAGSLAKSALRLALRQGYTPPDYPMLAAVSSFQETIAPELLSAVSAFRSPAVPAGEGEASKIAADVETCEELLQRSVRLGLITPAGPSVYRIHATAKRLLQEFAAQLFPDAPSKPTLREQLKRPATAHEDDGEPLPTAAVLAAQAELTPAGRLQRGSVSPFVNHEIGANPAAQVRRAYAHAIADFGAMLAQRANADGIADSLAHNEFNLLEALRISADNAWWSAVSGCIHGLGALYERQERSSDWERMLQRLEPQLCDPATRLPQPECDDVWRTWVTQGVRLEQMRANLHHAEDLQQLRVLADRRGVASESFTPANGVDTVPEPLSYHAELRLAESLHTLSVIRRDLGHSDPALEDEFINLADQHGEQHTAAGWARELGGSYSDAPMLRDLGRAERWYKRALELTPKEQADDVSSCLARLGHVAWERFSDARRAERPEAELLRHLSDARQYFQRAIEAAPATSIRAIAEYTIRLGHVHVASGDIDRALGAYREAIRAQEEIGDVCGAATTHFDMALGLRGVNRIAEARKHARAAHAVFTEHPESQADILTRTEKLLQNLESKLVARRRTRATTATR